MSTDSTTPKPRAIVLCFDGTTNKFCKHNTNVVKFYGLLDKLHPMEQIAYYQPGIGTYFEPRTVNFMWRWLAMKADDAIAWYLSEHVMEGYKFLMQNYRPGDKICLFGFSRGAYTARVLAGFLHKMGLLSRDNMEQVSFAYGLYKRRDDDTKGNDLAGKFKQYFCTSVKVDFIGAWETVASVGFIYGRTLPYTAYNKDVRVFRHALALDERRARFQPLPFHYETPKGTTKRDSEDEKPSGALDVEEVWFTGCHSDVGGGAVSDTQRHPLSETTLSWMVNQAILFGCGIKFDLEALIRAEIILDKKAADIVLDNKAAETLSDPEAAETLPHPEALIRVEIILGKTAEKIISDPEVLKKAEIILDKNAAEIRSDPEVLEKAKIKSYPEAFITDETHDSADNPAAPTKPTIEPALEPEAGLSSLTYGKDGYGEDIDEKGKERDAEAPRWPREGDAEAKIHDTLSGPTWWALEIMPTTFPWQVRRKWIPNWGFNLGRGRQTIIKEQGPNPGQNTKLRPKFHHTVGERMAKEPKYTPRAKWTPGTEEYVR